MPENTGQKTNTDNTQTKHSHPEKSKQRKTQLNKTTMV